MTRRIQLQNRIDKPWGYELIIDRNNQYALKHIVINRGYRSSLQSHRLKQETIYLLKGSLELEIVTPEGKGSKEVFREGEAYRIEPGVRHRVVALEDCGLVEVSTPQLDDVIRHEDDFGRANQ